MPMPIPGWFDGELIPAEWFDSELLPEAWFDSELAVGGTPPVTGTQIQVWSGAAWVPGTLKRWNGSAWEGATLKRWNGFAWEVL